MVCVSSFSGILHVSMKAIAYHFFTWIFVCRIFCISEEWSFDFCLLYGFGSGWGINFMELFV